MIIEQKKEKLIAKLKKLEQDEKDELLEKDNAFIDMYNIVIKLCQLYDKPYMKDYRAAFRKIIKMIQREFEIFTEEELINLMMNNFNKFINKITTLYNKKTEDNINE